MKAFYTFCCNAALFKYYLNKLPCMLDEIFSLVIMMKILNIFFYTNME